MATYKSGPIRPGLVDRLRGSFAGTTFGLMAIASAAARVARRKDSLKELPLEAFLLHWKPGLMENQNLFWEAKFFAAEVFSNRVDA